MWGAELESEFPSEGGEVHRDVPRGDMDLGWGPAPGLKEEEWGGGEKLTAIAQMMYNVFRMSTW